MTVTADAAGTWTLGDLTVNRLGFGAMRLAGDRDESIAVLRRAVELGVNHIDTAAFYFSPLRSANELINTALAPYDGLVIATKVGPGRDPWGNWIDQLRPDQLRGQVEENLRQLGQDHLDVVNFRRRSEANVADYIGALADLRDEGLIRHIGISNVGPEAVAVALEASPIVEVQNAFGVDNQPARQRELIRLCAEQQIAYVPFFSIVGGRAGAHGGAEKSVRAIAAGHGVSPAQIRLAWTLQLSPNVLAIPGTGSPEHLEQNVAAAAIRLTDDELAALSDY
ncbi:oxidoreductase [Microlunatus endophyticus]|uniref:Oxidoreductase n=1 Tax=Microlunatus endophyticus TaxID=1716077 RepID=A0A917W3X4_9ACTN|nr:aldo/keto reductase [Microlunatus endophyticus]GGL60153.1 oxidoreductase [Microlunatus endophyticus]